MSTLVNNILSIVAPKGVIPDLATEGKTPQALQKLANFFAACAGGMAPGAPGESRIAIHKGSTAASTASAYETCVLLGVAADTVVEINGVPFSAVNGTATAGNNEFDMSGSDAVDATKLAAAIMASTTAGIAGVVEAANLAGTATLASVTVGQKLKLDGYDFKATAFATGRVGEFSIAGTDTADATALAAAINAHPVLSRKVVASSSSAVVTVRQRQGTTGLTLSTEAATITVGGLSSGKLAAVSTLVIGARGFGVLGNSLRVVTKGVVATGTVTYSTSSGAQTVVINGVTVYNATGASDAANATAAAAAINASANALVLGLVRAVARAGVLKIFAVDAGLLGNAITLSATGTGATASGARLTGGLEASTGVQAVGSVTLNTASGNITTTINGVDIVVAFNTSDDQTSQDIAAAINASANALVRGFVTATGAAGVVNLTAVRSGKGGNAITLAAAGTGATASGARFITGAAATTIVPSAERLSGGVGGDDTSPTTYQF